MKIDYSSFQKAISQLEKSLSFLNSAMSKTQLRNESDETND